MLIGNCSLRTHTDDTGGLVLPWPRAEGHGAPALGIAVREAQSITSEREGTAPIVRTEVRAPSGVLEVLDFAPRLSAEGRIVRPSACIRIVRALAGAPEVVATLSSPGLESAQLGDGVELRAPGEAPVRVLGELAERAARGAPFPLVGTCAAIAVRGAWPAQLHGSVERVAVECLARTRDSWREFAAGLTLPLEPQLATMRAAVSIKVHEDEAVGGFSACDDPRSLLAALDRLGCSAEAARFCRADRGAAAAARRGLDVREPLAADVSRDLVAEALRRGAPGAEASAWLEHWAALRGAWLAAQALGAEREAETLRAALLGARAVLEERLFDERRGFVRRSPDEAAVGLESARLVTFGFFAPSDPRAATHLRVLAEAISHDLGATARHRCELAHALARVGRLDEARRWLAEVVSGGGPGDGLGASVAFVLAAFACSREWP